MDEIYYKKLVKRYLDKKSTDEELEVFVHLMKQGKLDKYIQEAMNEELGLNEQEEVFPSSKRSLTGLASWLSRLSVAAVLLLVSGWVIYFMAISKDKAKHSILATTSKTHATIAIADTVKVFNQTNAINKIVLPDRSIVWLQPNTRIYYPAKFVGQLRSVSMSGEAFFEVTKDHAHPFVITAGNVLTKVWGTSFRIKAIAGYKTKVSVLTGKVSVRVLDSGNNTLARHAEVMLMPSEEVAYQPAAGVLKKGIVPPSSDLNIWKKSDLSFENAALSNVIKVLNNSYHVNISAQDAQVNNYQITADFNGKNLADILLLICKSVHISYTKYDNNILFSNIN
jgi:transmembrane sensor